MVFSCFLHALAMDMSSWFLVQFQFSWELHAKSARGGSKPSQKRPKYSKFFTCGWWSIHSALWIQLFLSGSGRFNLNHSNIFWKTALTRCNDTVALLNAPLLFCVRMRVRFGQQKLLDNSYLLMACKNLCMGCSGSDAPRKGLSPVGWTLSRSQRGPSFVVQDIIV